MNELTPTHIRALRGLLHARAGITLDSGKEYLVEARLGPVAKQAGLDSVVALIELLHAGGGARLIDTVVEAMTINETYFFRDVHPFTTLRDTLIPASLERVGRVRIWCAAAATGQEPYSVAMLVAEHFAREAARIEILATDLCSAALERAKQGRYSQLEVNRGLPAPLLVKYFHRDGRDWQLSDRIRGMVRFRRVNLIGAWPSAGPFDLVLLRNVLLYFDNPTKRAILGRARAVLAPEGWLMLGAAESVSGLHDGLARVPGPRGPCYRPMPQPCPLPSPRGETEISCRP